MLRILTLIAAAAAPAPAQSVPTDTLRVAGLERPVEIVRDRWGLNHIYAETEADLFFAQGYAAARDRLFQLELWRRQAMGTVAEILGERELERDLGTRLFRFRGDPDVEFNHYHPRGRAIIEAFTRGINAYVAEARRSPETLPLEFRLLGIMPEPWTPDVVVSRHQGLLGNITAELNYGRAVARIGADAVRDVADFGPGEPDLALDPAIDADLLSQDILRLYRAFRRGIDFRPEDIVPEHRGDPGALEALEDDVAYVNVGDLTPSTLTDRDPPTDPDARFIGSNNWVVAPSRMATGRALMANDPHRAQAAPSLRYWVHLVGPGWNVIGGGEPSIPGVSIGHNEHGAWGLTVFATDGEDLYVYETDPADPDRYRYRGGWERMRVVVDTIPVKGRAPAVVTLRYTRHGPVVHQDTSRRAAFAVRAAWLEPGGAPYLSSLRMDQARTWDEFRDANRYSHIPGENMIWADTSGTIGWQAVGIAPVRRNWSGLVPVPGDGRYEWDGYLPILDKPHAVNPRDGFIATANNDLIPPGYPHREAVGWEWSDPVRWRRIVEVLDSRPIHTLEQMMALQTDYVSLHARALVPMLRGLRLTGDVDAARRRLLDWDYALEPESVAAGIYALFERELRDAARRRFVPESVRAQLGGLSMGGVLARLRAPERHFGGAATRDAFLADALAAAVAELRERLGPDLRAWRYGAYKHARLRHLLGDAVDADTRQRLEVGPAPRGGNGSTVNNTGNGDNQTSGASFRIIVDVGAWDRTVGTETPGQSGDPASPHYDDLFPLWARDEYFPVAFSRAAVASAAERRTLLVGVKP